MNAFDLSVLKGHTMTGKSHCLGHVDRYVTEIKASRIDPKTGRQVLLVGWRGYAANDNSWVEDIQVNELLRAEARARKTELLAKGQRTTALEAATAAQRMKGRRSHCKASGVAQGLADHVGTIAQLKGTKAQHRGRPRKARLREEVDQCCVHRHTYTPLHRPRPHIYPITLHPHPQKRITSINGVSPHPSHINNQIPQAQHHAPQNQQPTPIQAQTKKPKPIQRATTPSPMSALDGQFWGQFLTP